MERFHNSVFMMVIKRKNILPLLSLRTKVFVPGQKHFLCGQKRGEEKGRKQMSVSILWSVISPSLLLTLVRRENARSPRTKRYLVSQ